jgi:hypothetical protein
MKRTLSTLAVSAAVACSASGQVLLNEIYTNPFGSDSTATVGLEYFELRGTPNLSLAGYYLLSIEGQGTSRGDVNQYFDLGSFSIGANGYLIGVQYGSPYNPIVPGAAIVSKSVSQGWGQGNTAVGTSAGHYSDGTQLDLENSAATILLVNIGSGAAPTLTLDLDTENDGFLNLPEGWTILDSIGLSDNNTAAETDWLYGAINFRKGALGGSVTGPIIELPTTGTSMYAGRIGDSTGSTADDWFAGNLNAGGMAGNFNTSTDPRFLGKNISEMVFGGPNPVPEPGALSLLMLGLAGFFFRRTR